MLTLLTITSGSLITILISLLILAVVVYVVKLILDSMAVPPTIRTIAYLILFIIVLVVALRYFGIWV